MNILDIAIAKKLAGGGGGSGTDNYNDLSNLPKINDTTLSGNKSSSALGLQSEINSDSKLASDLVDDTNQDNKFVTSTEKNTWNGKQNAIDADHKINADYVDDSTSTNKFVTASDKETWNAKQNAIDNSHKLSSDLVDDTNHTNKFVTSSEKQTWNAKQNAIDSDHKLSSSLVSFTTAEAAALASGIDSSKVGQISTNQTNILYALNTGANNLAPKSYLTITGDSRTESLAINLPAGNYYLSVNATLANGCDAVFKNSAGTNVGTIFGIGNGSNTKAFTLTDTATEFYFYTLDANATFDQIMICDKVIWDTLGHNYLPPALPNYDLTRLESEDRAALAEEIDAGAKNLLDVLNRASVTTGGITCTFNSDGTITLNGTATGSPATYIYLYTSASGNNPWKAPNSGTYVMTCEGATTSDFYMYNDGDWGTIPLLNSEKTLTKGQSVPIIIRVVNGKVLNNVTVKPMICTKAAFGVSQKFVPWRGEANPTIYTKPIKDSKITSIDSGGYVRIGNLVNVNIRCTVGTAVAQYATLFTGLPKPVYDTGLSIGAGVIVCSTNRTILMITTEGVLQNFESTAIPTGILELSATYLCQ